MNINSLPVIGWIISAVCAVSAAVPFWIGWTVCGLGRKYFYFLPEVYQSIDFWECVGLFVVVGILKSLLTPRFASISQSNTTEASKK